jgi:hypothetical protein
LRSDGIWDVDDRPVRPHPKDEYLIEVDQTLGDEGGTRAFGFSDPHFWATTSSKEFDMKLPPKGSNSTMPPLGLAGRELRDPRYLQIVEAIKAFGPSTVVEAEDKIRSELVETATHPIPPQ